MKYVAYFVWGVACAFGSYAADENLKLAVFVGIMFFFGAAMASIFRFDEGEK